jgi:hypothetical protein
MVICPTSQAQYFFARDWTTQISLIRLDKSGFTRKSCGAGWPPGRRNTLPLLRPTALRQGSGAIEIVSAPLKNEQDVHLFERLAFLSRREV